MLKAWSRQMIGTVGTGIPLLIVTSMPSPNRTLNGVTAPHKGIDLRMPENTPIRSPFAGKVTTKPMVTRDDGSVSGGGNILVLKGNSQGVPLEVKFMHLDSFAVANNATVSEGQLICYSGNTGRSTGPHLHLEVWVRGKPVDPMPFLYDYIVRDRAGTDLHNRIPRTESTDIFFEESALVPVMDMPRADPSSMRATTIGPDTEDSSVDGVTQKDPPVPTVAQERLAPGIWQIIKLAIDHQAADRQVADSSISTMSGSLINFFHKVCQEPFVEIFGDTYGDEYYFVVRKPPFDKEGVLGQSRTIKLADVDATPGQQESVRTIGAGSNYLIIDEATVRSQNIGYDSETAYSWYQFVPKMNLYAQEYTQYVIPAVFFPEYAAIWGSRPYSVESNYYHLMKSGVQDVDEDTAKKQNLNFIWSRAYNDFKYLVESTAYLPFTRNGSLTISGWRGIKRGTWISYKGWLYYVDQVDNAYQISTGGIDYVTTLSLSRGLKREYVEGVRKGDDLISYFNLIDFGDVTAEDITMDNFLQQLSKWKVNRPSFEFFLAREHMLDNG